MQGAAVGSALARNEDTLFIDNKGVITCAAVAPMHECADMDLCQIVYDNLGTKTIDIEWVPSHCQEFAACNAHEREEIRRNAEIRLNLLAKMAIHLSMPDYDPTNPWGVAMCGGPTPTPVRKRILQCRRVSRFLGTQWTSWLPMCSTRYMLWVKWLLGHARWGGMGPP